MHTYLTLHICITDVMRLETTFHTAGRSPVTPGCCSPFSPTLPVPPPSQREEQSMANGCKEEQGAENQEKRELREKERADPCFLPTSAHRRPAPPGPAPGRWFALPPPSSSGGAP